MLGHERVYIAPRHEVRGYSFNVRSPHIIHTGTHILTHGSVAGGIVMAAIGLAYLIWEDRLLAKPALPISRALTGVQVRDYAEVEVLRDNKG